jgi:hypothetical protein
VPKANKLQEQKKFTFEHKGTLMTHACFASVSGSLRAKSYEESFEQHFKFSVSCTYRHPVFGGHPHKHAYLSGQ